MQSLTIIQTIAVWIIPVLLSITLHEAAHAWIASCCGDSTAKILGRLSINPLNHIDPLGTIVIPILVAILSGFHFVFGWAKPVPINWQQLRKPRRDMALVALAGPLSNLLMAFAWGGCSKIGLMINPNESTLGLFLLLTGEAGIFVNLLLAFLNSVPIPPLDGSRILASCLSVKWVRYYYRLEPFGFIIVLVLLLTGVLGAIVSVPVFWTVDVVHHLFHIK